MITELIIKLIIKLKMKEEEKTMAKSPEVNLEEAKKLAVKLAKKAGRMLVKSQGKKLHPEMKKDISFVTEMDTKVQDFIVREIKKRFPEHSIVGEESDKNTITSDHVWYVDPIDGTHNYINGMMIYGTMIGLAYKGEAVLGVINMPAMRNLCVAVKGKGTTINNRLVKVSETDDLKKGMIVTQMWLRDSNPAKMEVITKLHGKVNGGRDFGAAAHDFIAIANGSLDGHVIARSHVWDFVPGITIVQEAGGKVTDFEGKPIVAGTEDVNVVFSNGKVHNQLLKALR